MEIEIIRSDNARFFFERDGWKITDLSGIDSPAIEIFTQPKGIGNGTIITGKRYDGRDITIKAVNQKTLTNNTERQKFADFFSLNYTYLIVINYMGRVVNCANCELVAKSITNKKVNSATAVEVSLYAPDPMFNLMTEQNNYITPTTITVGNYTYNKYTLSVHSVKGLEAHSLQVVASEEIDTIYLLGNAAHTVHRQVQIGSLHLSEFFLSVIDATHIKITDTQGNETIKSMSGNAFISLTPTADDNAVYIALRANSNYITASGSRVKHYMSNSQVEGV